MKFTLSLRPTLEIERYPSRDYQACLAVMILVPLLLFAYTGITYLDRLQERNEELERSRTLEERLAESRRRLKKRSEKKGLRTSLLARKAVLERIFAGRRPEAAAVLFFLEESLPPGTRVKRLTYELLGRRFRMQLSGSAVDAYAVADLAESLGKSRAWTVRVKELSRTKGGWSFEAGLSGRIPGLPEISNLRGDGTSPPGPVQAPALDSLGRGRPTTSEGGDAEGEVGR